MRFLFSRLCRHFVISKRAELQNCLCSLCSSVMLYFHYFIFILYPGVTSFLWSIQKDIAKACMVSAIFMRLTCDICTEAMEEFLNEIVSSDVGHTQHWDIKQIQL